MSTQTVKRGRPPLFNKEEQEYVGFTLSKKQGELLENLATVSGRNRSQVMREFIDSYALTLIKNRLDGKIRKLQNVLDKSKKLAAV